MEKDDEGEILKILKEEGEQAVNIGQVFDRIGGKLF